MSGVLNFIKLDLKLLHRNNLFVLAAVVGIIYIGVFYLLKPLGDLTTILVVLIFNDPVVTGYLFAAVLMLFDKNQNTLKAFSVLPVPFSVYLFSKTLILSMLSTIVALIMAIATRGFDFNLIHLSGSVFLSTFIFSCCGFTIATKANTFNQLLIYSVPVFIFWAIPFLAVFDIGQPLFYVLIPSWGGIWLLYASLVPTDIMMVVVSYIHLLVFSVVFWKISVRVTLNMQQ